MGRHWRVFVLVMGVGLACNAWAQGGRRGATAGPPATGAAQGATGRGAAATGGAGAADFYNYDSAAAAGIRVDETPPEPVSQKVTIGGAAFNYTARAGYMPLRNATTGQTEADVFYTYYAKEGGADSASRPVVFFLGGEPGVSSGWQEFGGLGPKRMKWAADGSFGMPPYGYTDNPDTLLPQADLVFVDPVGTGYSRPATPAAGPSFWTPAGDVASMGAFVQAFTAQYERWNSPRILAGEDNTNPRVTGLATYLLEHNLPVNGIVLLSMTTTADATAGDEEYMTLVPTEIMDAWYHKKLPADLQALSADRIAEQARQFASHEYLHALYKGDRMKPEEQTKIVADLARFTGTSSSFVKNNDIRITLDRFNTELLNGEHRTMSSWDGRLSVYAAGGGTGRGGGGGGAFAGRGGRGGEAADPNEAEMSGGFLIALNDYRHHELNAKADGFYYLSGGGTGAFTVAGGSDDANLAAAIERNPRLRVFVAMNYYDATSPFYAQEFTLAHLAISPEARAHNITVEHFESGRMLTSDTKATAQLHAGLSKFLGEMTAATPDK